MTNKNNKNSQTVIGDFDFGIIQHESIDDIKGFRNVFYFIDHVNDRAYPLFSYNRPSINVVRDANDIDAFKVEYKQALALLKNIRETVSESLARFFPIKYGEISKHEYDSHIEFIKRDLTEALNEWRGQINNDDKKWCEIILYDTTFFELKSTNEKLAIFLNYKDRSQAQNKIAALKDGKGPQGIKPLIPSVH